MVRENMSTESTSSESGKRYSNVANYYPTFQDGDPLLRSCYRWLQSRRVDDRAEGLWRVHDKLYELSDFIDKHPGGRDWLALTKGTDITESFEVHHIYAERAENVLAQYYVRDALEPRNMKLTFADDGFYRTLKRRVAKELTVIDRTPEKLTKYTIDGLLLSTFALLFVAVRLQSLLAIALPSLTATWTIIAAHSFFHQRDNLRMYYFNIGFLSFREWRISHAMSHHLYPNSLHDLEITLFEPFLCWVVDRRTKNWLQRYVSWLYGPIVYSGMFIDQALKRVILSVLDRRNRIHWSDGIPFLFPVFMYAVSGGSSSIHMIVGQWLLMVVMSSFIFGVIGLNAGHHNPHCVHDGDILRNESDGTLDWGLYSMDTIVDNSDLKCPMMSLTHFGHHALHHLFPTVDHGLMPQLYPVFYRTLEDFNTQLNEFPWSYHLIGQLQQLARVQPTDYERRLKMRTNYLLGTL